MLLSCTKMKQAGSGKDMKPWQFYLRPDASTRSLLSNTSVTALLESLSPLCWVILTVILHFQPRRRELAGLWACRFLLTNPWGLPCAFRGTPGSSSRSFDAPYNLTLLAVHTICHSPSATLGCSCCSQNQALSHQPAFAQMLFPLPSPLFSVAFLKFKCHSLLELFLSLCPPIKWWITSSSGWLLVSEHNAWHR